MPLTIEINPNRPNGIFHTTVCAFPPLNPGASKNAPRRMVKKDVYMNPQAAYESIRNDSILRSRNGVRAIGPGAPYFPRGRQLMFVPDIRNSMAKPIISLHTDQIAKEVLDMSGNFIQFLEGDYAQQEGAPEASLFFAMNVTPYPFGENIWEEKGEKNPESDSRGGQSFPFLHPHAGIFENMKLSDDYDRVKDPRNLSALGFNDDGVTYAQALGERIIQNSDLSQMLSNVKKIVASSRGLTLQFEDGVSIAELLREGGLGQGYSSVRTIKGLVNSLTGLMFDVTRSFYPHFNPEEYQRILSELRENRPMQATEWTFLNKGLTQVSLEEAQRNLRNLGLSELYEHLREPFENRNNPLKSPSKDKMFRIGGSGSMAFVQNTKTRSTELRISYLPNSFNNGFVEENLYINLRRDTSPENCNPIMVSARNRMLVNFIKYAQNKNLGFQITETGRSLLNSSESNALQMV